MGWRWATSKPLVALGVAACGLGLAVAVSFWTHGAGAYAPLGDAGAAVFPLRTEVEFDTGEETPTRTVLEGTGIVLFERFVLTVAHAVTEDRLEVRVPTPRGEMTLPVEGRRIGEKTWLETGNQRFALLPLVRDEEADLALFLLPRGTRLATFPYPIGDSEGLGLGDSILVLDNDPVAGVLVREGVVAALRGSGLVAGVSRNPHVFLISLALTSGESGAPIIAGRRGSYRLLGLAQGTYIGPRQLAWAIRIGPALEALSRQNGPAELRQFLRLCRDSRLATGQEPQGRPSDPGTPEAAAAQMESFPSLTIGWPSTSSVARGRKNSCANSLWFGLPAHGACPIPMVTIPAISKVQ